jgi:enamine deaminase RidA (YjgF/YER057c/UK114 family)
MNQPAFFATPGYGDTQWSQMHYSQALRIGDRVETSGQGGWDDDFVFPQGLAAEITRAFDNLERTLAIAGAGWSDVVAIESYHLPLAPDSIGDAHNEVMVEQLRARMGDRRPIWTQLGVAALGAPGMRVEIRAIAVVDCAATPC